MKKLLSTIIFFCLTFAALQAYGQNWPHNMTNGIGCDSCHFVFGTEPSLLPPWTAHDPQDIDDTQFNVLCWSCHNDIDAPFVNTHSSLQIDNSYGDWSIECRVCHNPHGHEQIRAYGSESYLHEGTSTNVTATTLTQAGAGWVVDQWRGLPVFPNVLDLTLSYKILSNTEDTLTVLGPMNLFVVRTGDTFAIVYSKLIRSTVPTPDSGVRDVKFFDYMGPNSFADGDMVYDGICEVCHTMTTHHRNDGSGPAQSHNDGADCITCHSHLGGFGPSGGVPVAPHNTPEFIANCDYCHVSNTDFTTPVPDAKCEQCHTPTGTLKPDFPTAPDVITHQGTDCIGCHDPMFGSTNQRLVRTDLSDVGGGANVVFPPYITGPTTYNGVCETCHTMTNHHRNDGSAPAQSHNDDSTCTVCHPHANAFSPDVAPPPPPHDQFDCEVCHVTPDTYVPNAPIPNSACQECHGETAPGTAQGGSDLKVDRHYSDKYGMDSNCVDCHNPMSVQGSNAVFIRTTLASFDGTDYIHGAPNYDGICETCHTRTNHHRNDGSAPQQSHNDNEVCTTCHEHINGFRPGGECIECHTGVPAGATYVTRDVVGSDFTRSSRHVFGGTVTNWDCIVCHREGDENAAAGGDIGLTVLHNNGGMPVVDMRNVDTVTSGWVWDKNNTSNAMFSDMDSFCLGCHDADGASGINVKATDDGVNLSNARALTPFNSTDDVSQGIGGGTVNLPGYERTAVLDVAAKFDPTNPSHHAVLDQAYQSHNANWGDAAWVNTTLKSGDNLTTVFEAARLHCADCHTVDSADGGAHGGANGFMLQASSIDGTCFRCHNSNVYFDPDRDFRGISRWDHDQEGSAWDPDDWALLGQYGANEGSACLNCHGGDPAVDGFGGIHGLQPGSDWRSGEPRYRFQGGSYMSHQPSSWTGTSGVTATCYFSPESDTQDWSKCTKHGGDPDDFTEDGRTSPPNYARGVPGDY